MPQLFRITKSLAVLLAGCSLIAGVSLIGGCTNRGYYLTRPQAYEPSDAIVPLTPAPPRSLAMFEGQTGRVATWTDVMEGIAWADAIFVGEVHDHVEGHLVQAALVEDTLASFPGSALSMEMFERNDQEHVDAYLRGEIDVTALVERTKSLGWGMSATKTETTDEERRAIWDANYQPMVDAAKLRGSRVIAANAPREYVRRARSEGYDALRALPANEQALFDLPVELEGGGYLDRFYSVMLRDGERRSDPEVARRIENTYRSQQVWDATMGLSVARAFDAVPPPPKVIHIVGGFHTDYGEGTVTQFLYARPRAKVLTIQIVPIGARRLRDEDRGRADIVIYAERAPTSEPSTAEEPEASEGSEPTPTANSNP